MLYPCLIPFVLSKEAGIEGGCQWSDPALGKAIKQKPLPEFCTTDWWTFTEKEGVWERIKSIDKGFDEFQQHYDKKK